MRFALAVATVAVVSGFGAGEAKAVQCVGAPLDEPNDGIYLKSSTYTKSEAWQTLPGGGITHLHLETCLRDHETLTGTVDYWIRVGIFNRPTGATFRHVALVVKGDGYENTLLTVDPPAAGFTCDEHNFCSQWIHVPLNTAHAQVPVSGLQRIMFRAWLDGVPEPGGGSGPLAVVMFQHNLLSNGKPLNDFTVGRQDVAARAQWKGQDNATPNYCTAAWDSENGYEYPDEPFAGSFTYFFNTITMDPNSSVPTESWKMVQDADGHAGVPGMVLLEETNAGRRDSFAFDPGLGVHKLALRSDCRGADGEVTSAVLSTMIQDVD